ncbi:hypothetical protein [Endozoicomonas euniceicola]|uniref:Uncharacterized protein n=1 Tax=Endozoicomonas euniceicola TaxID=1234143 RepID=A0ABY6GMZ4_9GAMM|nr:hypothetical protein [Endozoicomonas euniceicola]UYM14097.1 hypothetical protein NX720_14390 [Endozoicomonas euniceicola]
MPAAIPGATSEAGTTNPRLGYQTPIETKPYYRLQQDNFGTLHSLVAYVTEMKKQLSPGQAMVISDDWKAELQILQQDTTGTTYSITLPGLDNTTSTYEVGSHDNVYWIKRFNRINIGRYQKIVWSEPEEGSATTELTIQLVSPMKYRESGVPIELTIPQWLSHRLLAAGSAMALADFNRLFIGWYRSVFLASDPNPGTLSKMLSPEPLEKVGSEIQNTMILASSDCLYCDGGNKVPVYFPHGVPESYVRKAPDSQGQASGSGDRNKKSEKTSLNPQARGSNQKTLKFRQNKGNDDKNPPPSTYNRSPTQDAAPKTLLEQATEVFFLNRGLSGQVLSAPLLPGVKTLIYSLSSAGMLQILPVEGVAIDQWPMVVSKRLSRYLNSVFSATGQSVFPEADGENEYVVEMTQTMFNNIVDNFEHFWKLADAVNTLQDRLKKIISSFCDETKVESCYYGGFSVREYLLNQNLDHGQRLYSENLSITGDIDVLFSLTSDRVEYFKEFMGKRLAEHGFKISGFAKDKLLFTFPVRENKELPYILSSFDFSGVGEWEAFNGYFPGLDVAMSKSEEQASFLTEAQVIAESVRRGLHFEASKRGTTTLAKEGKHWDRIFLLNNAFPKNTVFNMLVGSISLSVKNGKMAEMLNTMSEKIKKSDLDNVRLSAELLRIHGSCESLKLSTAHHKKQALERLRTIKFNQEEIAELQLEKKELANKISELTKFVSEESKDDSASRYLEKEQLNSEIKKLKVLMEESSKETEILFSEKENMSHRLKNSMILNLKLEKENSELLVENKGFNDEVFKLKEINGKGLRKIGILDFKNKELESELKKIKRKIYEYEQQAKARNENIKDLNEAHDKKSVDTSDQELKDKVAELEMEIDFLNKEKKLSRRLKLSEKDQKYLNKENDKLKKHIDDLKRQRLSNKKTSSPIKSASQNRAQASKPGINKKPEGSQWYRWFAHNAYDYKLELSLMAGAAALTGYKLVSSRDNGCGNISRYGFRQLCLNPVNDDRLGRDILEVMDSLPDEYRIISYRIFLANMDQGTMVPVKSKVASEIKKAKKGLNEYHHLMMAHSRHYPLWQMTAQQLLQIKKGISSAWKAEGKPGSLYKAAKGIIDYCGLMPDSIRQEECSREALIKLRSNRSLNNSVIFKGRDIKPSEKNWFIAFLPVWGFSRSGKLTWHDVWPYRLDSKGYTILGSAELDEPFLYKCDSSRGKKESIFTRLKWIGIKSDSCLGEGIFYITRSKNSVFWSRSLYRDDKHYVESNDNRKTFYGGAWEYNTSPHNSWRRF